MNNILSILFAVASFASPSSYTFTDVSANYTNHIQGYVMNPEPQYVRIRAEDYIYLNEMMTERDRLFQGDFYKGAVWDMNFFSGGYSMPNPLKSACFNYHSLSAGWDANDYKRFIKDLSYQRNEIVVENDRHDIEWCMGNMYSGGGLKMSNSAISEYATNNAPVFALKANLLTSLLGRCGEIDGIRVFNRMDDVYFRNTITGHNEEFTENSVSNFNNGSYSYYPPTSTNYTWKYDSGYDKSIINHMVESSYRNSLFQEENYYYNTTEEEWKYATSAVNVYRNISYDSETDLDNVLFLDSALISTNAASPRISDVKGWVLYMMDIYAYRTKHFSYTGDDDSSPEKIKNIDRKKWVWIPTAFTLEGTHRFEWDSSKELAMWTLNPTPRAVFNKLLGEVGNNELKGGWSSVVKFSEDMPDLEKPHREKETSHSMLEDRINVIFYVSDVIFDYKISPTSTYKEQQ